MSKEINLPPFYVGQKVVALETMTSTKGTQIGIVKGSEYIVRWVGQSVCCNQWIVDVGITSNLPTIRCASCNTSRECGLIWTFRASRFAPLLENFQSISLEKVLEEETKLIGVN